VGGVEEATKIWLHSQDIEVVSTHLVEPRAGRVFTGVQSHPVHRISGQTVKTAVVIAEIEIIGVRQRAPASSIKLQSIEALGLRYVHWAEQQGIQCAKARRFWPDGVSRRAT